MAFYAFFFFYTAVIWSDDDVIAKIEARQFHNFPIVVECTASKCSVVISRKC